MPPIDVQDRMLLVREFLGSANSFLQDMRGRFEDAISPGSEDQITDGELGRVAAFVWECEKVAQEIANHAVRIGEFADQVYHFDTERERLESERANELVADWRTHAGTSLRS
jgi:hypothetical protein